ncbi:hypothetical protein [Alteromonas sp. ASW11-130]|uniref:hypothetical protein n=1 Tax=Alteromonas sp. ASW11-130 TaxID=3015775 RepID=UPI002242AA17|nr:hypothetical protein [Alteromonas sp. ASW11-130]MCW8093177.1 hypothetical protein [Alteromonas sp. ASW11-130]
MKPHVLLIIFLSFCVKSYASAESRVTPIYYGKESFLQEVADPSVQSALPKTYRLLLPKISFPIKFVYSPFKRSLRFLQGNAPACNFYALENAERGNHYLFSLPLTFLPSPRVYTRAAVSESLLNEKGEIKSLTEMVQAHPSHVILLTDSISYGDELDRFIAQIPSRNIVWRASADRHNKISEMFFRNRAQIALIYPQEAHEYLTNHLEDDEVFYSYGVEGIQPIVGGKIMCNKFPQNEELINELNRGILSLYKDKDYIATQQLHTPEPLRPLLIDAISTVSRSHSELRPSE